MPTSYPNPYPRTPNPQTPNPQPPNSPPPPPPYPQAAQKESEQLRLACLLNLAACLLKGSKNLEAIGVCDRAIAIDEASTKGWFRRGQAKTEEENSS